MWFILIFATTFSIVMTISPPPKTALQHIHHWNRFRKFSSLIQLHNLTHYFEQPNITVFVPVTASYDHFQNEAVKYGYNLSDPGTVRNILLYHIGEGVTRLSDMNKFPTMQTFHTAKTRLFFNFYSYGDTQVYTVNGAWIVGADIVASNGVVHVINRYIAPLQSQKTVAQYMQSPDLPHLSFHSIMLASIIDPVLKDATNSSSNRFTVFAPHDRYINNMPSYGQDVLFNSTALLKTVFWAHVVETHIMYIPRLGDIPNLPAKAGVVKFYRVGSDVFVSNNKVRARIIQANIPVSNGVIHAIDDLLFFIYKNFRQKIQSLENVHFINNSLSKISTDLQQKFEDVNREMTFFLPTDDAFAKLPTNKQLELDQNHTHLTTMLQDHIIMYAERDFESFQDGETFTTADGKILTMHRINKEVYVEGDGIKARITVPDIGCRNGVIHLISNVLYQRDFTIWDAIVGNSQLSKMKEFLSLNPDIENTLRSTSNGPMTAFLISDTAYNNLPEDTIRDLKINTHQLVQAIQGSIAHGVYLSSTQIKDELAVTTISGNSLTLYNVNQGLYIIGSRIRANVVIKDIWCSNGILHVTDNILHLPTRNIINQMAVQPALGVMTAVIRAYPNLSQELSDTSKKFTMFVPNDDAFTYMPTYRAKTLSETPSVLLDAIRSHVVVGTHRYIEEYGNYTAFTSVKGSALFVLKSEDRAYAVSNNVKGYVVEENIRCTNGIIHVIDTLLDFSFWTVAEVMEQTPELKPFYGLLQRVDEFYSWSTMDNIQQTLFVPSANFLTTLSDLHTTHIISEPGMIRKIFEGHFMPGVSLNQQYLDEAFKSSRVYLSESRYNVTFALMDRDISGASELSSVDVGFTNLRERFDLVKDGIGCSNGVIYIINGFLNYPINDIAHEIKLQPEIGIGTDQLLKLIPRNSSIDLQSTKTKFTMFAPSDDSFNYLGLDEIKYINQNMTYTERMDIVRRHIVQGQQVDYEFIMNGRFSNFAKYRNITIVSKTDGLYIKWEDIEAKIVRPNILTTNGIIHVVDRLMLSTPYQTTTIQTTLTTTQKQVSSAHILISSSNLLLISLSLLCFVKFSILEISCR